MNKKRGWTLLIAAFGSAVVGFVFYLVGVISLIASLEPGAAEASAFAVVATFIALAAFVAAAACWVSWFATSNADLNQITQGSFNTTLWAIMLFVPIANIVALYKFSEHIHQAHGARGVTGIPPVVVFLLLWLLGVIGAVVAQTQMDKLVGGAALPHVPRDQYAGAA